MDAQLSRRERQIVEIIYSLGEASAAQVREKMPDPLSRNAVRTFLTILERKGHVTHRTDGRRFIYRPTRTRRSAGRSAVRSVLETFFKGSLEQAVGLHLSDPRTNLSDAELQRLAEMIEAARKQRKG